MFTRIYDNGRHRSLKTTMDNKYLLKKYVYPKTFEMVLKLLVDFQTPDNGTRCNVLDK